MADKYQIQSPGGKLLAPIELDTLIQMVDAGLVNGDTPVFDLQARRMLHADELAPLQGRVAPGSRRKVQPTPAAPPYSPPPAAYPAAPAPPSSRRFSQIPRTTWLIAGGVVGVALLGLAVAQAGPRLRGMAAWATNSGTPARIWSGALSQNTEDLLLYEQAKPRMILGGGERTRELLGGPSGDSYSLKRLEVSQRVVPLPTGTQVMVLRQDGGFAQVRVSEPGVNFNLTGYVLTAKLRRIDGQGPFDPNYQPVLPGM